MAWKLRKDKLKAGTTEAENPTPTEPTATPPPGETEQTPVFDLSGDAFQPKAATVSEEPMEMPSFLDDEPSAPISGHSETSEVMALPPMETVDLEPLMIEYAPIETSTATVTRPEFEPPAAPDTAPDVIAAAPAALSPEAGNADRPPQTAPSVTTEAGPRIDPGREAIAPGLVTMDTETGLPKVAPFILDMPAAPPATESPRMHSIVIQIGKLSATHFLTRDVTTIGRPDGLVQNYPDIEIELDDGISRRHAEIRQMGSEYAVVDVGSTNGTLLNGETLTPNEPVVLQPGDRIRLGERTELLFE